MSKSIMSYKEWDNRYNPFNSFKALAHAEKFEAIVEGNFKSPVVLNIDPSNACNYDCSWCMAREHRDNNKSAMLTKKEMKDISNFAYLWKIKACCIAGGGEPTLNKDVGYLVKKLYENGIDIGFVSNGYLFTDELIDTLAKCCRFVGFSVDAGYGRSYSKLKKVPKEYFTKILENMSMLRTKRNEYGSKMRIGYKYLVHPDNINDDEIYNAIGRAKSWGADDFHLRPLLTDRKFFDKEIVYTEEMVKSVVDQVERGREECENNNFKVYGIVHKFLKDQFKKKHNYTKCMATPLTTTWTAEGDIYLCVDRRGDESLKLGSWKKDGCHNLWGTKKHKEMIDGINLEDCPRCTNTAYNEMFEQIFIDDDPMMRNLI